MSMSADTQEMEKLVIKLLQQLQRKGKNVQALLWKLMHQFDDEQSDEKNNETKLDINKQQISLLYDPTHTNVCKIGHKILTNEQKHLSIEPCIICGHSNNNNKKNRPIPSDKEILKFLNKYPTKQIPFGPHENQKEEIEYWIDYETDKNWPLHYAAIAGDIKKIKKLSKNKQINMDQRMTDEIDYTPLTFAARFGQLKSVIELIKNGSNFIQPPDKGCDTPYKVAVYSKHKSIIVFFKEYIKYMYNFDIDENTNVECYQCYIYDLYFNKHATNGTMTPYVYCRKCTGENVGKVQQVQQNNEIMERCIIKTLQQNSCISVDTLCQMKDSASLYNILKDIMISGKPFAYWLWLLDIDHFKQINSQLTHAIADTKIQAVGQVLQSLESMTWKQWRDSGYHGLIKVWAFRRGGDEFALVIWCNNQKKDALQKLYERIRNNISEIKLENMSSKRWKKKKECITVSVGVCHGQGIDGYQQMMKKADEAAEMVKKDRNMGKKKDVRNGMAIYTHWNAEQKIWKDFNNIK